MESSGMSQMLLHLFSLALVLSTFFSISESNQFCDAGIGYGESACGVSSSTSPSKILIKGGTVVNAHGEEKADVYVGNGIIIAVKPNIKVNDEVTVLDATGKFVMPGGIDPHTHLAFEFMNTETVDDFFSGQAAALAGGTTMHIDFVIPVNGSLTAGFEAYAKKAKKSCMDHGFHMAITKWDEVVAKEMEIMVKEKGINSFKFFMAYKGALMINDELLLEGFKKCKSLGALAMVHAENGDAVYEGQKRMIELGITGPEGHTLSRPPLLEGEATARAIRLAGFVNTPLYVVHVMSIDAVEEIARARKTGQRVIGEPIAAGLALDGSRVWDPDFVTAAKYVMSPPLRASGHNKALQAALSTGVLQLVGTDHCSFNSTQKALGIDDFRKIPNGVNGIEERMHLVWDIMVESGQISVTDYVRVTSTECARIFNIYPRKGAILPGSDADIIILNPNSSVEISAESHHSRSDTNVYEGRKGKGKVEPNPSTTTTPPTTGTTVKKSKKKNNNVWVTKSTRKSKKKNKSNNHHNTPAEEIVLITPIQKFPDKSDDTQDMKICLSKIYKAEKVELSDDRLSAGSTKGYRMVRATRGVVEGAWYFEIKVVRLGASGHTRLGWSTEKGDLQAPVGYDGNSFGYRDIDGSKVHKTLREKYGEEGYKEGDVIGFYISLPEGGLCAPKPPHLVLYKGQRYACAPDAKEEAPKVVPGSEISFFKNGICQGVAFKDLCGGRYYPAASMYTLPNQPNCVVNFNFGPDFEFFPAELYERPVPRPMVEVPYHGFENRVENGVSTEKKH